MRGMFCLRCAAGLLCVVLLAQAQDRSHVKTELTDTDPVDVGIGISVGPDSVTVKNERFTRVFRIDARTQIDRVDSSALQAGDQVAVRCHFDDKGASIADSIRANVDRWEGKITKVLPGAVCIEFDTPDKSTAEVFFDKNSEFGYCASDDPTRTCTLADLKVGRHLERTGFVLSKNEMSAVTVLGIRKN